MLKLIQKFHDFVNQYGILFHSLSLAFWLWILNMNVNNPERNNMPLKIFFYATIVFIVLSLFNLIISIRKKIKRN